MEFDWDHLTAQTEQKAMIKLREDPKVFDRSYYNKRFQSKIDETPNPIFPSVIILAADNVKLIRNNSVPML